MLPHRLALPLAPTGEVTRETPWENKGFGHHIGEEIVLVPKNLKRPLLTVPSRVLCIALSIRRHHGLPPLLTSTGLRTGEVVGE